MAVTRAFRDASSAALAAARKTVSETAAVPPEGRNAQPAAEVAAEVIVRPQHVAHLASGQYTHESVSSSGAHSSPK